MTLQDRVIQALRKTLEQQHADILKTVGLAPDAHRFSISADGRTVDLGFSPTAEQAAAIKPLTDAFAQTVAALLDIESGAYAKHYEVRGEADLARALRASTNWSNIYRAYTPAMRSAHEPWCHAVQSALKTWEEAHRPTNPISSFSLFSRDLFAGGTSAFRAASATATPSPNPLSDVESRSRSSSSSSDGRSSPDSSTSAGSKTPEAKKRQLQASLLPSRHLGPSVTSRSELKSTFHAPPSQGYGK